MLACVSGLEDLEGEEGAEPQGPTLIGWIDIADIFKGLLHRKWTSVDRQAHIGSTMYLHTAVLIPWTCLLAAPLLDCFCAISAQTAVSKPQLASMRSGITQTWTYRHMVICKMYMSITYHLQM